MVGYGIGILSAGFMGLYVEPILKANCFNYHDNEVQRVGIQVRNAN